jgi:invasion protein IalB
MFNRYALPFALSVLALSVLLSSVATPARAQQASDKALGGMEPRGDRKAREIKYGDWKKYCFKTPGSNMVCRTSITGTWETGQSAVRIDMIEREGEDTARLQLFLPVGLYLKTAARLTVDQSKPYEIPYVWCLTNTCIAGERADANLIKEMESGEKLKLEVVDTNLLTVSTLLPLGQFAPTRKSTPSQIYQQDVDE